MKILCSPTEPKSIIHDLDGIISSKPEKMGVDFLWMAHKKWYGVQRKRFPDDLEASLTDGRLAKEIRQIGQLELASVVLEGFGQWTLAGEPMGQYTKLTKDAMFGLLTSLSVLYSLPTYRVRDQNETVECIQAIKKWTESKEHQMGRSSLDRRPSSPKNKWGTKSSADWALHFLQGFDGIGPVQAGAIMDHFGGMPLSWDVTYEDLLEVAGIGPKRAKALIEALA